MKKVLNLLNVLLTLVLALTVVMIVIFQKEYWLLLLLPSVALITVMNFEENKSK